MNEGLIKSPKKRLALSFLIGFIIFFVIIKFVHAAELPEVKYSLIGELIYSTFMGIVFTCASQWQTVKNLFS